MESVSGSSYQSGVNPLHESETSRLQGEVDMFTKKFENEKRKLQILQDQIKQIENEQEEKRDRIAKIKPEALSEKMAHIKMKSQAHEFKNEQLKLNQTKAKNLALRREIDMLRKELTSSTGECKQLQK